MEPAAKNTFDQLSYPAFTVKDGKILEVNEEAALMQLTPGTELTSILYPTENTYETFEGGTLFLSLSLNGQTVFAAVTKENDHDLFILDEASPVRLQTLALAGKTLRGTYAELFFVTERIKHDRALENDYLRAAHAFSSMRLHRLICNMSDVTEFKKGHRVKRDVVNLKSLYDEVFEKTAALLGENGPTILYHSLPESLVTMADPEKLQRAAYNLLSNAIKFTPKDGVIEAWLTQKGSQFQMILQDNGDGISDQIWSSLFTRFHRRPGIEDCRHGLGLGLLLTSSIAIMHGGTLLVQQLPKGTRVSFTISLDKLPSTQLFTHPLIVDYEGGADIALRELSDVLPLSAYYD